MINKLGYTYLFDWQQKMIKINENNNWNNLENAENALEEKIEAIANLGESEAWKTLNCEKTCFELLKKLENKTIT
ncbi:unnamed protein product [Meloidogyne enterolobii]|uniref:Uncharacterized protein n=1 Tax=Meloidogyne enterolobii TaxID=390850 RepID=A0ACB0YQ22_MELEN